MNTTLLTVAIDQKGWLDLGIVGAALLIILITIMLIFNQQSKSIDKLCTKIDVLVTNISNNNIQLNEVLISNDKDQKEIIHQLNDMCIEMRDIHNKVVRIDARLFDHIKQHEGRKEQKHETVQADTDK